MSILDVNHQQFDHWLSETAEAIIAAGLQPERWTAVPKQFSSFPGVKAILYAIDYRARASVGTIYSGLTDKSMEEYGSYYFKINPWVGFWSTADVLRPYLSEEVMPANSFKNTEFYGWLRGIGEAESAVGIKLFDDKSRLAIFSVITHLPAFADSVACRAAAIFS